MKPLIYLLLLAATGSAVADYRMRVPLGPGAACAHGGCEGGGGAPVGGGGSPNPPAVSDNFDGANPNTSPDLWVDSVLCGFGGFPGIDSVMASSAANSYHHPINTANTCGGLNVGTENIHATVPVGVATPTVAFNLAVVDPSSVAAAEVTVLDSSNAVISGPTPLSLTYGAWQPVSVDLPGPGAYTVAVRVHRIPSALDLDVHLDDMTLTYVAP